MVADIRAEFNKILEEIDWMDPMTKGRARQKADAIAEHIGYPSELTDDKKLEELYSGLHLNKTHYLGNALNMTIFGTNYAFSKLREKVRIMNKFEPRFQKPTKGGSNAIHQFFLFNLDGSLSNMQYI